MAERINKDGVVLPTPGRIVWYQTDGRNFDYYLPAIVTITKDNLVQEAVNQFLMKGLSSETHVHLTIMGGASVYREYDVPFDAGAGRRTWRWPEINRGNV